MGYTHYWYLNSVGNNEKYQKAKKAIVRIINVTCLIDSGLLGNGIGEKTPYTKDEIKFNGKGSYSHETFYLPNNIFDQYRNPDEKGFMFEFCKTAWKPYDIIVVACLTVLKYYLGKDINVSSDGYKADWIEGVELASEILGIKFKNPIKD